MLARTPYKSTFIRWNLHAAHIIRWEHVLGVREKSLNRYLAAAFGLVVAYISAYI